jgi:hypothetical protein
MGSLYRFALCVALLALLVLPLHGSRLREAFALVARSSGGPAGRPLRAWARDRGGQVLPLRTR